MQLELSAWALGGPGILTGKDTRDLNAASMRVLKMMSDHEWHTAEEIELAAGKDGIPAREGLRRMRQLRQIGFDVSKKRKPGCREWVYKLED